MTELPWPVWCLILLCTTDSYIDLVEMLWGLYAFAGLGRGGYSGPISNTCDMCVPKTGRISGRLLPSPALLPFHHTTPTTPSICQSI